MVNPDHSHSDRVRSYFDTHAQDWSRAYRPAPEGEPDEASSRGANDVVLAERLRLALDLTSELAPASTVLDAGCGAGPLTVELARRGHRVVAVDLSPQMIDLCQRAVVAAGVDPSVELACGDILEMGRAPKSFDAIFAMGFLQYQNDEQAALRGLRALLRPGGRLVVSGPNRRRLGNVFGLWDHVSGMRRRLSKSLRGSAADELDELLSISTNSYSIGRFRGLLTDAGFEHLTTVPHGYVNYALIGPLLGPNGELALHRFFTRVSRAAPIGHFANDLVALAARPEE